MIRRLLNLRRLAWLGSTAVMIALLVGSGFVRGADYNESDIKYSYADPAPVYSDPADAGLNESVPAYTGACGDRLGCDACCGGCSCCRPACGCCGCGACAPCRKRFGLILSTDTRFSDFISPISNPVFFEDPRSLTEARVIFLNQHTPPELGGDSFQVYAMQLRAALTERLSFIATKDGFIVSQSPLLDDGWADVAAGLKYGLWADPVSQTLLSVGLTYEMPVGSTRSLQGNGDGEFHLFLSGGAEIAENWHWISGTGFRLPSDSNEENQVWYWSNHLDRRLGNTGLYALAELNWHHWLSEGDGFPLPIEGVDLVNLGSVGVEGNDVVTSAFGLAYKPGQLHELAIAYEFPLTDRRFILDNRLNVNLHLRY
jgi:hypothetical protein